MPRCAVLRHSLSASAAGPAKHATGTEQNCALWELWPQHPESHADQSLLMTSAVVASVGVGQTASDDSPCTQNGHHLASLPGSSARVLVVRMRFVDVPLVLLLEADVDCADVERLSGVLCRAHGDQPRPMGTWGALEAALLWRTPFSRATSARGSGESACIQTVGASHQLVAGTLHSRGPWRQLTTL